MCMHHSQMEGGKTVNDTPEQKLEFIKAILEHKDSKDVPVTAGFIDRVAAEVKTLPDVRT
jgi:hypothetical protein